MNQYTRISFLLLLLTLFGAASCHRGTYTQAQVVAAGNAIRQLDRVKIAVTVKAPRNEYDLVLDTSNRAVAELLPNIPTGALKQEIKATLEAYADGGKVWKSHESKSLKAVFKKR